MALGAGLGEYGFITLMEGHGNEKLGAESQGIKLFMAK